MIDWLIYSLDDNFFVSDLFFFINRRNLNFFQNVRKFAHFMDLLKIYMLVFFEYILACCFRILIDTSPERLDLFIWKSLIAFFYFLLTNHLARQGEILSCLLRLWNFIYTLRVSEILKETRNSYFCVTPKNNRLIFFSSKILKSTVTKKVTVCFLKSNFGKKFLKSNLPHL